MSLDLEDLGFVEILPNPPKLFIDMRYSTNKNFTHKKQYKTSRCFIREEVAKALHIVCLELEKKGFGLLIWDAYRPLHVQKNFQQIIDDGKFVSKNSPHCKGIALDVTLVDSEGGYLDMGTDFDDFTSKASHSCETLDSKVLFRREILKAVMEKQGFESLNSEWWHYTYSTTKKLPVLDISF